MNPAGILFPPGHGASEAPLSVKAISATARAKRETPKAESPNRSGFCLCSTLPSRRDRALWVAISKDSHTISLPIIKEERSAPPGAGSFMLPFFHLLPINRAPRPPGAGTKARSTERSSEAPPSQEGQWRQRCPRQREKAGSTQLPRSLQLKYKHRSDTRQCLKE